MMRKLALALALSCMATLAYALGLGNLQLNSNLNEPFDGRIDLLGATPDELDSLRVTLASIEEFRRAGLDKPLFLSKLRFRLVRDDNGPDYIQVSSHDPVREPFLDFLLEVNWSTGRFIREYTVLLDPPVYDDTMDSVPGGTLGSDFDSLPEDSGSLGEMMPAPAMPAPAPRSYSAPAAAPRSLAGEGIQVGQNDTLWSLASANRPDEGVSVQQMMLALLNANPEAFQQQNVNTLKAGYVLRVPDRDTITSISRSAALDTVKQHHAAWQQYRLGQTDYTPVRPQSPASTGETMAAEAAAPATATDTDSAADTGMSDGRLELVAPSADETMDSESAVAGTGDSGAAMSELEQEQLESTLQANEELQDQLTDADEIIALLERKIELQENDLATAQQVFANQGYEQEVVIRDEEYPGYDLVPEGEPDWKIAEHDVIELNSLEDLRAADADVTTDDMSMESEQMAAVDEDTATDGEMADSGDELMTEEVVMPPAEESGALDGVTALVAAVIPASLLALVPGGALSVLGLVLLVIILVALLVIKFVRNRAETVVIPESEMVTDEQDADAESDTVVADEPLATNMEDTADLGIPEAEETEAPAEEEGEKELGMDTITDLQATLTEEEANAAIEEEEDPLEEVNVYLAYERFDAAEDVVRKAIADNPDEHKFKLRLLEVFYSANEHAKYEETAKELHDATGGEGPLWDSAVSMWAEMSPDRELFAEGETRVADSDDDQGGFVDLTAETGENPAGMETVAMDVTSGDDNSLDFTLDAADDTEASTAENTESDEDDVLDLTQSADDDDVLDLTGSGDTDALDFASADDDDILDLTGPGEIEDSASSDSADDDLLDMTGDTDDDNSLDFPAGDDDVLDLTADSEGDDELLDLTAPSSSDDDPLSMESEDDSGMLDVSDDLGEDLLDVTAGEKADDKLGETADSSLLDITSSGDGTLNMDDYKHSGEDLLDVTNVSAATDSLDAAEDDEDADLEFDIGSLSDSEDSDSDNSLDLELGSEASAGTDEDADEFDFDLTSTGEDSDDDAFDLSSEDSDDDDSFSLDLGTSAEDTDEDDAFSLELGSGDDSDTSLDEPFELEIGDSDDKDSDSEDTIKLDPDDAGLELDIGASEEDALGAGGLDLTLGGDDDDDSELDDGTIDLSGADMLGDSLDELAESLGDTVSLDADEKESTIERASGGLDLDTGEDDDAFSLSIEDDDDDGFSLDLGSDDDASELDTMELDIPDTADDSETLVLPPDDEGEEQSLEDEIDTRLNLAKAYIELGDKEGARTILDEVSRDGDERQQQDASELLKQLD